MTNAFYDEQPLVMRTLENMIKKRHIPHALIFNGDKSTSKRKIMYHFIKMLYADYYHEEIYDGGIYHRIDNDLCPNVIHIERDKKTTISADFIKDAMSKIEKVSVEDGPKIMIIEESDFLSNFSSNAILKFVEEPLDGTYIIFLTENLSNILDTIISRCSVINFKPLSKDMIKSRLLDEGYKDPLLGVFIEYTQNDSEIRSMFENKEMNSLYNLVVTMFQERFEHNGSMIIALNERFDLLKNEYNQDVFLSFMSYYLMDIVRSSNKSTQLVFNEEKERISKIRNLFNMEDLSGFLTELLNIKSEINSKKSINLHLYLDDLLLRMEIKARR